jgi:hypothetical protein
VSYDCLAIDNAASCKICTVVHFINAKIMSAAEIHHELCSVYGQNVMSEGTVRQWCRMFREGRSGQPSVMSDVFVQNVDQKFAKHGTSQFQNFHVNFHKFQHCFL